MANIDRKANKSSEIDRVTSRLSDDKLVAVSAGMMMNFDPIDSLGIGAYGVGGPGGYLVYQGGVAIGLGIKDWLHGRK